MVIRLATSFSASNSFSFQYLNSYNLIPLNPRLFPKPTFKLFKYIWMPQVTSSTRLCIWDLLTIIKMTLQKFFLLNNSTILFITNLADSCFTFALVTLIYNIGHGYFSEYQRFNLGPQITIITLPACNRPFTCTKLIDYRNTSCWLLGT